MPVRIKGLSVSVAMAEVVFMALNILDAWLTNVGLSWGATEANPLMGDDGASIPLKLLLAAGILVICRIFNSTRLLGLVNFLVFAVVVWNLAILTVIFITRGG